ncbi:lipoyl(octanoyl) transferase LipB [Xanthocytophaga agilis]|uniref:Octanoyltransferase n=1 Tax=Xanthocytophaga agilis TaxID=3048010 RepID=A0AAE3R720_9BACT|nr:lipoyl(octanoyl) transferase LipB [Xanthocytophaga agilis]MDJ1502639.1 lipoyl(octanoyl) transferase LipB [Xanthocytophaga agilis]
MNPKINKSVQYQHLGLADYQKIWDYQTELFQQILDVKTQNRDLPPESQLETPNFLLFCEHPHVYTLGRNGKADNLLHAVDTLADIGATYYHSNRGGDITYHGPGQIVVYPILDLENFFTDIHKYMRLLEEAVIRTLAYYEIDAGRITGLTGVWIDYVEQKQPRKICAMGVKTSRWATMHGLALNVTTDLSYFNNIIPCGISDKAVTSLAKEIGQVPNMAEVEALLLKHISSLFEMELTMKESVSILSSPM